MYLRGVCAEHIELEHTVYIGVEGVLALPQLPKAGEGDTTQHSPVKVTVQGQVQTPIGVDVLREGPSIVTGASGFTLWTCGYMCTRACVYVCCYACMGVRMMSPLYMRGNKQTCPRACFAHAIYSARARISLLASTHVYAAYITTYITACIDQYINHCIDHSMHRCLYRSQHSSLHTSLHTSLHA